MSITTSRESSQLDVKPTHVGHAYSLCGVDEDRMVISTLPFLPHNGQCVHREVGSVSAATATATATAWTSRTSRWWTQRQTSSSGNGLANVSTTALRGLLEILSSLHVLRQPFFFTELFEATEHLIDRLALS
jgi:hypothetical protein